MDEGTHLLDTLHPPPAQQDEEPEANAEKVADCPNDMQKQDDGVETHAVPPCVFLSFASKMGWLLVSTSSGWQFSETESSFPITVELSLGKEVVHAILAPFLSFFPYWASASGSAAICWSSQERSACARCRRYSMERMIQARSPSVISEL